MAVAGGVLWHPGDVQHEKKFPQPFHIVLFPTLMVVVFFFISLSALSWSED